MLDVCLLRQLVQALEFTISYGSRSQAKVVINEKKPEVENRHLTHVGVLTMHTITSLLYICKPIEKYIHVSEKALIYMLSCSKVPKTVDFCFHDNFVYLGSFCKSFRFFWSIIPCSKHFMFLVVVALCCQHDRVPQLSQAYSKYFGYV